MRYTLFSFLLTVIISLSLTKCGVQQAQTRTTMQTDDYNYEQAWDKVDSLDRKQLPKSARETVLEIYRQAKEDGQHNHLIKSVIYRAKYIYTLEEEGLEKAIESFRTELEDAPPEVQALLYSMLGEGYMRYAQSNQWTISQRSQLASDDIMDIRQWDLDRLYRESFKAYLRSLDFPGTKETDIEAFELILTRGKNNNSLRPTLYDFLAHRALDHFIDGRSFLTQPVYAFTLDDDRYLSPVQTFINLTIQTRDSLSAHWQALKLFQEVLRFHLDRGNTKALIDTDLKRLQFLEQEAVFPEKQNTYRQALGDLSNKHEDQPQWSEIQYLLAKSYYEEGQNYQPNPENKGKYALVKAREIAQKAIDRFPESFGASQCTSLINRIEAESFSLKGVDVIPINTYGKMQLEYTNIDTLHWKVVKATYDQVEGLGGKNREEMIKQINEFDAVTRWRENLPDPGTYRSLSTEIKIDPLEAGHYLVVASQQSDFSNHIEYIEFHVSDIALIQRKHKESTELLFVHRTDGYPMDNVEVKLYKQVYKDQMRKMDWELEKKLFSDKNGQVTIEPEPRKYYQITCEKNGDYWEPKSRFSHYPHHTPKIRQQTHFFTDRSIYRPGQTVYFKAYLLEKDPDRKPSIVANKSFSVELKDVNGQNVSTMTLRSNKFGTAHGSFPLPAGGITGRFQLVSSVGMSSHGIQVEEYKRPKFEVKIDTLESAPTVGDTVEVSGQAQNYAGTPVSEASVSYRVVRQTRFPYFPWWRGYRSIPYRTEEMEITNGVTETNDQGAFIIPFVAVPDKGIPIEQKPVFHYRIEVDVTDLGGETRSTSNWVKVGYTGVDLSWSFDREQKSSDSLQINIQARNLNGAPLKTEATLTVESLNPPGKLFRNSYWGKVDTQIYGKELYNKWFPYDAYGDEDQPVNWPIVEEIYRKSRTINDEYEWKLERLLPIGKYKVSLTVEDTKGNSIEQVQFLTVFDHDQPLPHQQYQFLSFDEKPYEPGEHVKIYFAVPETAWIWFETEEQGDVKNSGWHKREHWLEKNIPIDEKDRGGLTFRIMYVMHNRFHSTGSSFIRVPWSNKVLNIEFLSFRDKTKPGEQEEWQLKISGPEKDRVAAEMLSTLYDASLDQFIPHHWDWKLWPMHRPNWHWDAKGFSLVSGRKIQMYSTSISNGDPIARIYRQLNWFGFQWYDRSQVAYQNFAGRDGVRTQPEEVPVMMKVEEADELQTDTAADSDESVGSEEKDEKTSTVQVRENLDETVFFFPDMETDEEGNVILAFTMNEALTRWKFLGLAHTKELAYGFTQKEIVTQKDLMVFPNAPRFVREGDTLFFSAKINSLVDRPLEATVDLELFNTLTMNQVDDLLGNRDQGKKVTLKPNGSAGVRWKLIIPENKLPTLTYRVIARSGNKSDGEEGIVPVLPNRMLVTETMPLWTKSNETKSFEFEAMEKATDSKTLTHHRYTLEYTSNPAWYAVQSLPYIMEYPYDCSEQVFNRLYANSLAGKIIQDNPGIKKVYDAWSRDEALESPLSKNQELKQVLLSETPWVMDAQSEEEQMKRIALLFDLNKMNQEERQAIRKLADQQLGNGGFPWFPGGRDNWYITQYIVEGFGHMQKLGIDIDRGDQDLVNILRKAVEYCDARATEAYEELKKEVEAGRTTWEENHLTHIMVHYLYARSFFLNWDPPKKIHEYYLSQAEKYWTKRGLYNQGMLALVLGRYGKKEAQQEILNSLMERSLSNEELGRYWKYNRGFYWYQMPIETQALMIELFAEAGTGDQYVDELKVWLLKNKQTNSWGNTKATAAAIYALLQRGSEWLDETKEVNISVSGLDLDKELTNSPWKEAGTQYFKVSVDGEKIDPAMAKVTVENPNEMITWGAVYWQYFEDLDKIEVFKETPLDLSKELYRVIRTDRGEKLEKISGDDPLRVGAMVKVRVFLEVDRDMEFVHLKDMRASGMEPINVLSRYKWQDGLGYYETTRDAATHFFIDYLPKGSYVFEYPLRVFHAGTFSNGISTVQCMYAPEFSSHSAGETLKIKSD